VVDPAKDGQEQVRPQVVGPVPRLRLDHRRCRGQWRRFPAAAAPTPASPAAADAARGHGLVGVCWTWECLGFQEEGRSLI
jgi:hypothetical protein